MVQEVPDFRVLFLLGLLSDACPKLGLLPHASQMLVSNFFS